MFGFLLQVYWLSASLSTTICVSVVRLRVSAKNEPKLWSKNQQIRMCYVLWFHDAWNIRQYIGDIKYLRTQRSLVCLFSLERFTRFIGICRVTWADAGGEMMILLQLHLYCCCSLLFIQFLSFLCFCKNNEQNVAAIESDAGWLLPMKSVWPVLLLLKMQNYACREMPHRGPYLCKNHSILMECFCAWIRIKE